MESGYVVMGEAAGILASHAVKSEKKVQELDFEAVKTDMKSAGVKTYWNGKGYGPKAKNHWPGTKPHWLEHPEDYRRKPLCLDPSWERDDSTARRSGPVQAQAFPSVEDWNRKRPGYEWMFPFIDKNADGKVSLDEHQAFQDYKKTNHMWKATLRKKSG